MLHVYGRIRPLFMLGYSLSVQLEDHPLFFHHNFSGCSCVQYMSAIYNSTSPSVDFVSRRVMLPAVIQPVTLGVFFLSSL